MPKLWKFKTVDQKSSAQVADLTGLPEPIARILTSHGLQDKDTIDAFLNPRLSCFSDPFLLPDMNKAVSRIVQAIEKEERITVFGDYDVDGVTSCALLTRVLTELGAKVVPFIPDRLDEGYGLSQEALERCLEEDGSSLVITVDCGVNLLILRQHNGLVKAHHHQLHNVPMPIGQPAHNFAFSGTTSRSTPACLQSCSKHPVEFLPRVHRQSLRRAIRSQPLVLKHLHCAVR